MTCPVCRAAPGSLRRLYPEHEGECVTSDMSLVARSSVANRVCVSCGLIFNAGGPRGRTKEFYEQSYRLRMHTERSQNINFSTAGAKPMAEAVSDFLAEHGRPGPKGRLLEAGAGKGEFLVRFRDRHPTWDLTAFEPSTAVESLATRVPSAAVHHGAYQEVSVGEGYDVVASLSVIEHVEQPLDFLCWLRDRMAPSGRMLITCPDFARNPNDIFCVDHLSKLTGPYVRAMAHTAGLEVVASKHVGIALLVLLRHRAAEAAAPALDIEDAAKLALSNAEIARSMIERIGEARRVAAEKGEKFAIFGLGSSGLIAPTLLQFDRSEITAYIDENETMQGTSVGPSPVLGLEGIERLAIRHIALSTSPIYREQICSKLQRYAVSVYG